MIIKICDGCPKTSDDFTSLGSFSNHLKSHNNEVSCDQCGKALKNSRVLTDAYKMLKVEQMGESLHKTFNELERRFSNQFDKAQQYYLMLREYENSLYVHI